MTEAARKVFVSAQPLCFQACPIKKTPWPLPLTAFGQHNLVFIRDFVIAPKLHLRRPDRQSRRNRKIDLKLFRVRAAAPQTHVNRADAVTADFNADIVAIGIRRQTFDGKRKQWESIVLSKEGDLKNDVYTITENCKGSLSNCFELLLSFD